MKKKIFILSFFLLSISFGQTTFGLLYLYDNHEIIQANSDLGSYSGSIYFKYDVSGSNRPGEKLYIHYGSNSASVTSTTPGSSATVKCQEGKVYYSFTGKKSDMVEIMDISEDDCGKTFKYSLFNKE